MLLGFKPLLAVFLIFTARSISKWYLNSYPMCLVVYLNCCPFSWFVNPLARKQALVCLTRLWLPYQLFYFSLSKVLELTILSHWLSPKDALLTCSHMQNLARYSCHAVPFTELHPCCVDVPLDPRLPYYLEHFDLNYRPPKARWVSLVPVLPSSAWLNASLIGLWLRQHPSMAGS